MFIPQDKDQKLIVSKLSMFKNSKNNSLLDVPVKHFIQGLSIKNNYPDPSININSLSNRANNKTEIKFPVIEKDKRTILNIGKKIPIESEIIKDKLFKPNHTNTVNHTLSYNNSFITSQKLNKERIRNIKEAVTSSENKHKVYNILSGSGSDWIPRNNRQNLLNHSSVKYSILSPSNRSINNTREEIISAANNRYNPTFFQKSISEFIDLSQSYKNHKNPIFSEAYHSNENTFKHKSDICNEFYKKYKTYEGIALKPFTKNKFI
jgi:hypothetical protein